MAIWILVKACRSGGKRPADRRRAAVIYDDPMDGIHASDALLDEWRRSGWGHFKRIYKYLPATALDDPA